MESVVLAGITLHNFLREKATCRLLYSPSENFDNEDTDAGIFTDGSWRPEPLAPGAIAQEPEAKGLIDITGGLRGRQLDIAKRIRDVLCDHFNSEAGAVPWQDKMMETGIEWK